MWKCTQETVYIHFTAKYCKKQNCWFAVYCFTPVLLSFGYLRIRQTEFRLVAPAFLKSYSFSHRNLKKSHYCGNSCRLYIYKKKDIFVILKFCLQKRTVLIKLHFRQDTQGTCSMALWHVRVYFGFLSYPNRLVPVPFHTKLNLFYWWVLFIIVELNVLTIETQ
jgi:hypothetical protein